MEKWQVGIWKLFLKRWELISEELKHELYNFVDHLEDKARHLEKPQDIVAIELLKVIINHPKQGGM